MGTKTAAELIKALKDEHNVPGIMEAYKLFKELLAVEIPSSSYSAPALNKIETLFTRLNNASHTVSDKVQAMLDLAKLPTSMDFVTQMIVQEKDNAGKAKDPTIAGIHTAAVLSWDQRSIQGKGKAPAHADKLSAVKLKGSNPSFNSNINPKGKLDPQDSVPTAHHGMVPAEVPKVVVDEHEVVATGVETTPVVETATTIIRLPPRPSRPTMNPHTLSPIPAPSPRALPLFTKEKKALLLLSRSYRLSPSQIELELNPLSDTKANNSLNTPSSSTAPTTTVGVVYFKTV